MSSDDLEQGPRLGSLVRLTYHALAQRMSSWLAAAGHADLQPAHSSALQPLAAHADGLRLTALAEEAHVTKQTMGALVDHLERTGYVERLDDPDDRRASRICLTRRGRAFVRDARAFAFQLEADLAARVGAKRIDELIATLRLLNQ